MEPTTSRPLTWNEAFNIATDIARPESSTEPGAQLLLHAIVLDLSEAGLETVTVGELISFLSSPGPLFAIRDARLLSLVGLVEELTAFKSEPTSASIATLRFSRTVEILTSGFDSVRLILKLLWQLRERESDRTLTLRRYTL